MSLKRRKRKSDASSMLTAKEMREKYLKQVNEIREQQGLEPFHKEVTESEKSLSDKPVLLKPVPVKKALQPASG